MGGGGEAGGTGRGQWGTEAQWFETGAKRMHGNSSTSVRGAQGPCRDGFNAGTQPKVLNTVPKTFTFVLRVMGN